MGKVGQLSLIIYIFTWICFFLLKINTELISSKYVIKKNKKFCGYDITSGVWHIIFNNLAVNCDGK